MVRSGDWLTPRLNGIAHFDKPPLAYWATAIGLAAIGIDEVGARIGLVVAGLAVLVLVHCWAADWRGPRAGLAAVVALGTAPLFVALGRSVTTDLYLALWVALAADAARRGSRPGAARGWRLLVWGAVGAGFLTKGPVVLLWTALPALGWAAATGGWDRLRRLVDPLGTALAAAIALPWYVLMAARHPGLLGEWLGRQTLSRMTSPYDGESDPWWLYLATAAWAAGPWIVPAGLELVRGRRRPAALALAAWAVLPLVGFSLFPTKRANYLLPALVPLAIAAGAWWAAAGERPRAVPVVRGLALLTAAGGAGLLAAAFLVEAPTALLALGPLVGPALLAGGVLAWRAAGRGRFGLAQAGLALPLCGLYLAGYAALGDPAVEGWFKISRPLAVAARDHATAGEPIVAYRDWPRAFPFYLDRRVVTVTGEGRVTRWETDPAWRRHVFTADSSFYRLFRGEERILVYLPRGEREAVEARLGEPLRVLAATRRHLLVENRPADRPR